MARRPQKKNAESRLTAVERGIRLLQVNETTIIKEMREGFARMETRLEQIYNHVDGFMKLHARRSYRVPGYQGTDAASRGACRTPGS